MKECSWKEKNPPSAIIPGLPISNQEPVPNRPVSSPPTSTEFRHKWGEVVTNLSNGNPGLKTLHQPIHHPGRHEFKITQLSPQSRNLLRDLRVSAVTGEMTASPYDRPVSDPEENESTPESYARKYPEKKTTHRLSKGLCKQNSMKMRFVRVVRGASSVPDLSKEPTRSAMKSSRNSSHSSLHRIKPEQPYMCTSPIARNSDSLSLTPPSPAQIPLSDTQQDFSIPLKAPQLFIDTQNVDDPSENEQTPVIKEELNNPAEYGPSYCLSPFVRPQSDQFHIKPKVASSPKFAFRSLDGELFRAVSAPRKSEGSPVLRTSSGSDKRFTFQSHLDSLDETGKTEQVEQINGWNKGPQKNIPEPITTNQTDMRSSELANTSNPFTEPRDSEFESDSNVMSNLNEDYCETEVLPEMKPSAEPRVNRKLPRFHNLVIHFWVYSRHCRIYIRTRDL
ncbi:unnamed protein product [Echinostoma caproni]|uniref:Uncharacterized protein n=1 Tax=Echinostoma caproni TaxID=27848 RepID=A0A183A806_9TREM|nr:unnamed protein product [Echinostoma caproni]